MGYFNNLSIDTRTCGDADEDARLDRRDGLTTRHHSSFTPAHRSAAWWREFNAEQRERGRGNVLGMWKRGLTSSGTRITAGHIFDLERAGFVVKE